jgi:tetraacyldisaccharide 4'-kinase
MICRVKNFWQREVVQASKQCISTAWQRQHRWVRLLWPLSLVYLAAITLRRFLYRKNIFKVIQVPATVIVVGNITVGGTGKTPFVIWLTQLLKAQGYHPGIVSRGYGGRVRQFPILVTADSAVEIVGDEPLLLAHHSGCPVMVAPNRVQAAQQLIASQQCDIIVSDDGLQHYALARQLEVVLMDDNLGVGSGLLLPAGPLREPVSRLKHVDFCFKQGRTADFQLKPVQFVSVQSPHSKLPLSAFDKQTVHAVAGIGHPSRFFATLKALGATVIEHAYPDHHPFKPSDIAFKEFPIVMTEKDAVKCRLFATEQCWHLQVETEVKTTIPHQLLAAVRKCHG